jgi:hypothetical protein
MNYFDDLLGSAKTLVEESEAVLNLTQNFKQALTIAKKVLTTDYTAEDIEENLGDVDFANDFADELGKTLKELQVVSENVSAECATRKHNLDAALSGINKYFDEEAEEEVVELAADAQDTLGQEFAAISNACTAYFQGVSDDVERIS